jgi:CubicO group peptidase (beta-lactamase class C family)
VIDDPSKSPYLKPPKFFSGGGGLVSTARDYSRFCQTMLNLGVLEGTRLLQSETVLMMTRNQLPAEALPMAMPAGAPTDKGLGFGLGFAVRIAPDSKNAASPAGEYFWGGAASTGFSICPKNDTVVVALTQFMPCKPTLAEAFIRAVDRAVAAQNGAQPRTARSPERRAARGPVATHSH